MSKTRHFSSAVLAGILLIAFWASARAETAKVTTYYSSPNAEYQKLSSTGTTSLATGGGSIGIGTSSPDSAAALDIFSSSKGVLLPKMSTRPSSPTPPEGLLIYNTSYNTSLGRAEYYTGDVTLGDVGWVQFGLPPVLAWTIWADLTYYNIIDTTPVTLSTPIPVMRNVLVGPGASGPQAGLEVRGSFVVDGSQSWAAHHDGGGYDVSPSFLWTPTMDGWNFSNGNGNIGIGMGSVIFGANNSGGNSSESVILGHRSIVTNSANSVSLGENNRVSLAPNSLAIGSGSDASSVYSTAIGTWVETAFTFGGTTTAHPGSIAIGSGIADRNNSGYDYMMHIRDDNVIGLGTKTAQAVIKLTPGTGANTFGAVFIGDCPKVPTSCACGGCQLAVNGNIFVRPGHSATSQWGTSPPLNWAAPPLPAAIHNVSDIRLKSDIAPLHGVLDGIKKIRAVTFNWRKDTAPDDLKNGKKEIGVVAQEIEKAFPEVVNASEPSWGVNYSRLGVVALAAIKELSEKNEKLKVEILRLEALKRGQK